MREEEQEERSVSIVREALQRRWQDLLGGREAKIAYHADFCWNLTWKNIDLSMSVGKDRPKAAKMLVTAASDPPGWKRTFSCLVWFAKINLFKRYSKVYILTHHSA
ncbi:hypothetical protein LQE92_00565 [Lacrimispora sp. NSJ-141]|uniref:Uncharacterized protein n=1 Tax=Lientehia hominis TaxID=2897778 RepID=A0AAP2RFP5_9FIRM|nr:hypothetical protein [Lientehia hominis]MCD2491116.1 hypothetical protein [Lientehia hominis]